ncbi:MYXO-CTERM sorting domain-containing protein [Myxococcota bacterium]|nr:MYXO-CTERM sorting domain-containing protein [Myxococcota bacterium]
MKDDGGDCGCASSEAPAGLGALTAGLALLLARRRRSA